ncbi:MAG: hypothetical protein VZR73_03780 [Acutalibacteraceae bacterium]|nr:hypothetical protein [Acutalibacteraceae bacterium]
MSFLLSHIWLPYLLALALIFLAFFFDLGGIEVLLYTAVVNLIPVLGLWCIRRGYMIPAVIIAILCCAVLLLAAWGIREAVKAYDKKMKAAGAVIGLISVISTILCCISSSGQILQTVLAVCCLFGMLGVVYIFWWFSEFGKGMGSP